MADTKKLAYVLKQSPYCSDFSHDAIDAVLAGGLYGQTVSVFFIGDGVFQLLHQKSPENQINNKPLSKKLNALSLYDIDHIYVCGDSLASRGIDLNQLSIAVSPLSKQEIDSTIRNHNTILSF